MSFPELPPSFFDGDVSLEDFDDINFDFVDHLLSPGCDMDSLFLNDNMNNNYAMVDIPPPEEPRIASQKTPDFRPFSIQICASSTGAPPKFIINETKVRGCVGDCDAACPFIQDLAKQICDAATIAHRHIHCAHVPSKNTPPFTVHAIVINAERSCEVFPLTISPYGSGKTQLGHAAQRKAIFRHIGESTWYISIFSDFNVLLIVPEVCLMPSLMGKLRMRSNPNDKTTAVFFKTMYGGTQKQVSLSQGKYTFFFHKSTNVPFSSVDGMSLKRSRESSYADTLRACIIESKVDVPGVLGALAAFPYYCVLDNQLKLKFERRLNVASDRVRLSIILQLAKFVEDEKIDLVHNWVGICGVFK